MFSYIYYQTVLFFIWDLTIEWLVVNIHSTGFSFLKIEIKLDELDKIFEQHQANAAEPPSNPINIDSFTSNLIASSLKKIIGIISSYETNGGPKVQPFNGDQSHANEQAFGFNLFTKIQKLRYSFQTVFIEELNPTLKFKDSVIEVFFIWSSRVHTITTTTTAKMMMMILMLQNGSAHNPV